MVACWKSRKESVSLGMVDPDAPKATAKIRVVETGEDFEENIGKYLGTAIINPFVWHVFLEE